MDFSWVTTDDADAIQNAIVDAKGDLIAASAADTPARLAVGANGETLVADSSTTTGLRYQPTMAAGKNAIINGGFEIWQRGTSFSSNPSQACADRWFSGRSSVAGATFSRQTSDLTGFNYKMRVQRDSGNSATNAIFLNQSVENLNSAPFIDRPVTLSFYAKAGANYSAASSGLAVSILSGTGTDQNLMLVAITGQATVASSTVTLTTSWQRFQITGTSASSAKQLFASFTFTPVGTAGADDFYEITGVQLEVGSIATAFTNAGGTIQGELAACQRYYYRNNNLSGATFGLGQAYSITNALGTIPFPTSMRINPTALEQTGTAANYGLSIANLTFNDCTAVPVFNTANVNSASVVFISTGVIAGNATHLVSKNSAAYLAWSAEL
jgi:hypothetical protein